MRLIDADALIKEFEQFDIKDIVDYMPTVDPVRHGRWIADDGVGKWHCSKCQKRWICLLTPPYCPNCGARMDGDE